MRLLTMPCPCLFRALLSVPMLLSSPLAADDQRDREQAAVKTAKERLVSKAADAQRINDCKVPIEQRDADQPRPDDCKTISEPGTTGTRAARDQEKPNLATGK
jgi:hypothetical protein